jgi:hypothetical protein
MLRSLSPLKVGVSPVADLTCAHSLTGLLSGKLFGTKSSPLKGVFIVLMGTSGCGKSHTIRLIQQTLVEKGVREELIHHLQRDEFIVKEGARLLGKDITDVSYSEAYNEITRVHEQDLLQGNEGIKSKVHNLPSSPSPHLPPAH